jgi:4-hydroxybutyrate CoA-transferase
VTGLLDGLATATILAAMSPQLPSALVRQLLDEARAEDIDVHLIVADLSGTWDFLDGAAQTDLAAGQLRITALAGTVPRQLADLVGHLPVPLWETDRLIASGALGIDVFLARVEPQSFGAMVGYSTSALSVAPRVAFEVVPTNRAPLPGSELDISIADHLLTMDPGPRAVARTAPASDEQRHIARLTAALVPDGATLQLGIGAVPDLIAAHLVDRHDLGLHSGLLPGSTQALIASGAVTGRRKSRQQGRHVATGVDGGDPNGWGKDVLLQPLSKTHDPQLLLGHENLWALNSAYQVDLAGQVNAEYIGRQRRASGAGQADFARAAHAGGGASVITVPSRTSDGRPRIVTALDCPVTTPASDIDYVVTEHGVAHLTGRTGAERAAALVAVAHPDDRTDLLDGHHRQRNVA